MPRRAIIALSVPAKLFIIVRDLQQAPSRIGISDLVRPRPHLCGPSRTNTADRKSRMSCAVQKQI